MNGWTWVFLALATLGGAAFAFRARATTSRSGTSSATGAPPAPTLGGVLEELVAPAKRVLGVPWEPPSSAAAYRAAIAAAELTHGIPRNLLARLLYQESHFRPDIIDGRVVSSAGALGIAQIIPRWHPTVDPLEPFGAIRYAASYLASLRRQFGSWGKALAAYNWGPTNFARISARGDWLDALELPGETRKYVTQILADVPEASA